MSDHLIAKDQQSSVDAQMDDIRPRGDGRDGVRARSAAQHRPVLDGVGVRRDLPRANRGLVGYGAAARTAWALDYPWGLPPSPGRRRSRRPAWPGTFDDA